MGQVLEIFGAIFIFIGVAFSVLGIVGILRLPDTYTRLHASGKTSTLGVLFLALGTGFILPSAALKLIALSIFIIFSAPVGSHAIAAAVHRGTAIHNEEAIREGTGTVEASGVHSLDQISTILEANETQTSSSES